MTDLKVRLPFLVIVVNLRFSRNFREAIFKNIIGRVLLKDTPTNSYFQRNFATP